MSENGLFAHWLKRRRKSLDLTREELSKRANCSVSALRRLEVGDLRPGKQLAESLAGALDIPYDQREAFVRFARGDSSTFIEPPRQVAVSNAHAERPIPTLRVPAPLTSLIGRKKEVAAVCELLREPGVRLLTLTGPPGIGKTRLSIAAADELIASDAALFPDGAYFVSLAPIGEADMVASAIAQTLDVRESGARNIRDIVREFLRPSRLLLVLDNFEQVIAAAPLVTDLLTAAPGVKALVTSREVLRVYGEHEYPIPPLGLPDVNRLPTTLARSFYSQYSSIQLFRDRARAARSDFALTPDNLADVARICAWLDGLPLAIEMAAAQVKWLPTDKLFDQLSHRLVALTNGPRDLSPRQQSLSGAIDWSYNLLDDCEKRLFNVLSVFAGGCSEEAIMDLLPLILESECDPLEQTQTLESKIKALVEKSLLRHEVMDDGQTRYSMLESIREYAQERLDASEATMQARELHARHYQQIAQRAALELGGPDRERWLGRCGLEINNLRAALRWYSRHEPEAGLQLAVDLREFWQLRGLLSEGRAWLDELLSQSGGDPIDLHAHALIASAALAVQQGDLAHATTLAQDALALSQVRSDPVGTALALHHLGNTALYQSDYTRAESLFAEALALFRQLGSSAYAAQALNNLGLAAKDQGDFARAEQYFQDSLALRRETDNQRGIAQSLINLANAAYWQGDYTRTAEFAAQALDISRELDDKSNAGFALESLGMALFKQRHASRPRAMETLKESLALFTELGDKKGAALVLTGMGTVAHAQGDFEQAVQLHRQSLKLCMETGEKRRAAFCLEGLAMVASSQSDYARAIRLFAAASSVRQTVRAPLPDAERAAYEPFLVTLHAHVPLADFQELWAEGQATSLDEAAAMAQVA